jgi:dTDP-4-dehydrorhamnose 3,5-epimerase
VKFFEQAIAGVFTIEVEASLDERGLFARTYSRDEFAEHDLSFTIAQASVSFNERRGTLRGMHLQLPPSEEAKLVRCLSGAVYDVVVDLRRDSPTQLGWLGVELHARRRNAVYIPSGLAHGFITLEDSSELEYLISTPYAPAQAVGVRWDDPAIGISWPSVPSVISERDAAYPDVDVVRLREEGPPGLLADG